jgi:hypothetical protein
MRDSDFAQQCIQQKRASAQATICALLPPNPGQRGIYINIVVVVYLQLDLRWTEQQPTSSQAKQQQAEQQSWLRSLHAAHHG